MQRVVRRFDKKENDEKTVNKEVTFIVLQKIIRSMHSSERIEDMVCASSNRRLKMGCNII